MLLKIITDCVNRVSEHLDVKWVSIGYWRMHRHLRESPQKDLFKENGAFDITP